MSNMFIIPKDQLRLPERGDVLYLEASRWRWRDGRKLGSRLPKGIEKCKIGIKITSTDMEEGEKSSILDEIDCDGYTVINLFGDIFESDNLEMYGVGHGFDFQWVVHDIEDQPNKLKVFYDPYNCGHQHCMDHIHQIFKIENKAV